MSDSAPALWQTRSVTFLLAALAAGSASFWVLHWPEPARPPSVAALSLAPAGADSAKVAALLGAQLAAAPSQSQAAASLQSHFKLWGIIAQDQLGRQGARGSALIAVDGAPAKPYQVGQQVAHDMTLQSVVVHRATLGPKGQSEASVTLELPAPPSVIAPKPVK